MSKISVWIISISVCVVISVIIDIILPAGKMNKITRAVMGIFTMIVIISPIKNIDIKSLNLYNISPFSIDNKFVEERNDEKLSAITLDIQDNLKTNGYENVYVEIKGTWDNGSLVVENVYVDLENLVIKDSELNINKYNKIMAIISSKLDVDEKKVIFYE